jgi:hypothetical protein
MDIFIVLIVGAITSWLIISELRTDAELAKMLNECEKLEIPQPKQEFEEND